MKKQPDYAVVRQTDAGLFKAYFKGRFHGVEDTKSAWALLWNGPIGDDLIAFQRQMEIDRALHREAERLRKAMFESQEGEA